MQNLLLAVRKTTSVVRILATSALIIVSIPAAVLYADTPGLYNVSGSVSFGNDSLYKLGLFTSGGSSTYDTHNAEAITASDGSYTVSNLPNGSYPLEIAGGNMCVSSCAETLNLNLAVENPPVTNPPNDPITVNGADISFNLSIPRVPINVTVKDSNGNPVSGASPDAASQSGQATDSSDSNIVYTTFPGIISPGYYGVQAYPTSATTDSNGQISFDVVPGFIYNVCASDPSGGSGCTTLDTNSSTSATVQEAPPPPTTHNVTGAVNFGSDPLYKLGLFTSGGSSTYDTHNAEAITASDGSYTVSNLPNGSYPLEIAGGNMCVSSCAETLNLNLAVENPPVTNPPNDPITVNGSDVTRDLSIPRAPLNITVDESGNPVTGANVGAASQSGQATDSSDSNIVYTTFPSISSGYYGVQAYPTSATTDSSGQMSLDIVPGFEYNVCASSPDGGFGCAVVDTSFTNTVLIQIAPPPPPTFTLSGSVSFGSDPLKKLGLFTSGGSSTYDTHNSQAITDSSGDYTVSNLADGTYPLDIAGGNMCISSCAETLNLNLAVENPPVTSPPNDPITVNGSNLTRSLSLPRETISVKVEDAGGNPVSGASPDAASQSGQATDSSDSNIVYTTFPGIISPGYYGVQAYPTSATTDSNGQISFDVVPGFVYNVCASDPSGGFGCSTLDTNSSTSVVVQETIPTVLNLSAPSPTTAPQLTWSGIDTTGTAKYAIYRNGSQIGTSTNPSFVDATAPTGTNSYYVNIEANGYLGFPSNTIQVTVTPPVVTGLSATTPTNSAPILSWSPVTNVASYNIYRQSSTQTSPTLVGSSTSTTFTDNSLVTGGGLSGTYIYTVTAVSNSGVEGPASSPFSVVYDITPPSVTDVALSPSAINPGQASSLTAVVTDSLSGVQAAEYFIGSDPGQGNGTAMTISNEAASATLGSNLSSGTYTVNVRAESGAGVWSSTQSVTLTVNQTIGFGQPGGTLDTGDANYMNGTKFTVGSVGGTAQSMSAYVGPVDNAPDNGYQMAIFTVKADGKPGTLVAQTGNGTLTANAWNTLPITATLSANTQYWLMYNTDATQSNLNEMYYSVGEQGIGAYAGQTFGSWPGTYPTNPTLTNTQFSLTLTYTPSGPIPPAPTPLVGDNNIESNIDSDPAGTAEAFQYTATTTGNSQNLGIYLNGTNAATQVTVGLYTDSSNAPGTLLGQATISSPLDGTWNSVMLSSQVSITAGTKYWIVILAPKGDGTVGFRDQASDSGTGSITSKKANLTTLPSTWTSGTSYSTVSLSAYAY